MHRWPRLYHVTAVTLIILLTGVTTPAMASKPGDRDGPALDRPINGETLFRGLYFGRGPAAAYFPEIWQNPQILQKLKNADVEKSMEAQNRLMELLRESDATIFTRFGAEMQSGDQVRVRDTLTEMGQRMRTIATERLGVDPATGVPGDINGQCVVLAIVLVVAVVVAVVVAGVIDVYLYVDFWGPDVQIEGSSHLQRDLWIDTVTQRLAGTQVAK